MLTKRSCLKRERANEKRHRVLFGYVGSGVLDAK